MGSRHPRPGPLLQLPGPLTPRLSTRYPRPARYLQDSYQTRSSLSGPTMPSIRRSLDQLGHGPSACSTRISSAHKLPTGSGRVQSPDGLLRHPPPRKGQWLQSPSRTLNHRLPEFDLPLRGVPGKSSSCTRASTSPLTSPSRPQTPQLRPASPWLLCTQGHAFQVTLTAAGPSRTSRRARPGAPNATIRWGRPMLLHAATLLLSVGDIMGFDSP